MRLGLWQLFKMIESPIEHISFLILHEVMPMSPFHSGLYASVYFLICNDTNLCPVNFSVCFRSDMVLVELLERYGPRQWGSGTQTFLLRNYICSAIEGLRLILLMFST